LYFVHCLYTVTKVVSVFVRFFRAPLQSIADKPELLK
jgi:hypothetical protein